MKPNEKVIKLTADMIINNQEFGISGELPTAKELGLALVRANREARRYNHHDRLIKSLKTRPNE